MKKILFPIFILCLMVSCQKTKQTAGFIDEQTIVATVDSLSKKSEFPSEMIDRSVRQAAELWTENDGTAADFKAFCLENHCATKQEKEALFHRLCDNFETLFGHANRVTIELLRPLHVVGYQPLPIDELFGTYDATAHLNDDMFANKIAFVVKLNFPFYSLEEKNANAEKWNALEWGYARLGDLFTDRVPAQYLQAVNTSTANADHYISNYNIYMGQLRNANGDTLFPKNMILIFHWGLRDELKSNYADKTNGLEKQKMIYQVMQRIIDQSIPTEVINKGNYTWNPYDNQLGKNGKKCSGTPENDVRYQQLLNNFKAVHTCDPYYKAYPTYIARKFEQEYEISVEETEKLFTELLAAPQVKEVARLIEKRLGRKLQPFDIWYDGFKSRSTIDPATLDQWVETKYPTREAFAADLPNILTKLNFSKEKAAFICSHVSVDASVGAGHAWESMMKNDNAMLRTRIGEKGMDYKGYNIGVHEFGHNVEQTISLHDVPNYFLAGVPNVGCTEALAFIFQARDLDLLGVTKQNEETLLLNTLDAFWGCYEIMGVSLLDIKVWQWLYAHPDATAAELKEAVISNAKEIWNQYYAPVFGIKDQPILAIYSHSIDSPLYLAAYPMGQLIEYQLENYLTGKSIGTEIERIYALGRLTPQYWLKQAVGEKMSCTPLLQATETAVQTLNDSSKK